MIFSLFSYFSPRGIFAYRHLVKVEAAESNLCEGIDEEKHVQKLPEILTPEEIKVVNEHTYKVDYNFWRIIQIFFHSGPREIELFPVKKEDVDLEKQRFKVLVKKGQSYREEWRTIKTIVTPL